MVILCCKKQTPPLITTTHVPNDPYDLRYTFPPSVLYLKPRYPTRPNLGKHLTLHNMVRVDGILQKPYLLDILKFGKEELKLELKKEGLIDFCKNQIPNLFSLDDAAYWHRLLFKHGGIDGYEHDSIKYFRALADLGMPLMTPLGRLSMKLKEKEYYSVLEITEVTRGFLGLDSRVILAEADTQLVAYGVSILVNRTSDQKVKYDDEDSVYLPRPQRKLLLP